MGRDPRYNPDKCESFKVGSWWSEETDKWLADDQERIYLPMDSRTTASPWDAKGYIFYRIGGWSWVAPYLSGIYALALQVNPHLTIEEFAQALLITGSYLNLDYQGRAFRLGPIFKADEFMKQIITLKASTN